MLELRHQGHELAAQLVAEYTGALQGLRATSLEIAAGHALKAGQWNVSHRDPFDRMLAAQSKLEKLPLISCDPAMEPFDIDVVWRLGSDSSGNVL